MSVPGPVLEIRDLGTVFHTEEGVVRAVDGVSLGVERGQVLAIVGESGSGKSVTGLSILRLVPDPPGRIVSGAVLFRGKDAAEPEDLLRAGEARMRALRGNRIAMVFQDPMTSLNPYMRVGEQLVEVLAIHGRVPARQARERAVAMLEAVGIPAASSRFGDYPHHLSGGMRQRVMIAMALLCEPEVLIADEPTTALDVTIQAQILKLLRERTEALGAAVVLITHDLGIVARMADRVAVMYAGRIVEEGPAMAIFHGPRHPYTVGLLRSVPRLSDPKHEPSAAASGGGARIRELPAIPGMPPSLARLPPGCPFHPRCAWAMPICEREQPVERALSFVPSRGKKIGSVHTVRCHADDLADEPERARAAADVRPRGPLGRERGEGA